MFTAKKNNLFNNQASAPTTEKNSFIKESKRTSLTTTSLGNGAVKLTSTDNSFVDQFANASNYRKPRTYQEIDKDMRLLWSQHPLDTLSLSTYLRMITRVIGLPDGTRTSTTQRGQGLKHEGIFRQIWLHINAPETFWKNIPYFISIGSWKDVITMLSYDLQWNGWEGRVLDWEKFGTLIKAGLENPNTSQLILKYLPQIKANKSCNTLTSQADNIIAKWICSLLFGNKETPRTYKQYRKMKSAGTAHQWQQLISRGKLVDINFDTVHGRALAQLVSGNFLKNNKLERKYQEWISSKSVAKYTGYPYELFIPLGLTNRMSSASLQRYQIDTINKQFDGIIETAKKGLKEDQQGFIAVIDSSRSMMSQVPGTKVSSYSVAKVMALYFSSLLTGPFANVFLEFSDTTVMREWKGNTAIDKLCNDTSSIVAGTNFRSVGIHFINMLRKGVSIKDFPTGILCVTDNCFNNTRRNKSETQGLREDLLTGGFPKEWVDNFKIILWEIPNQFYGKSQTAFEDFADSPNLFHISGLDPAAIAFLLGVKYQKSTPKNSEELFAAAMDQEILKMLEV